MPDETAPKKKRKPPPRSLRWRWCEAAQAGVLTLTVGKLTRHYHVCEQGSDMGRGFRLTRLGVGDTSLGEQGHYNTHVGGQGNDLCDCMGHLAHGTPCKHIAAIRKLIETGAIKGGIPAATEE